MASMAPNTLTLLHVFLSFNFILVSSTIPIQEVGEGSCWTTPPKQIPFDYDWMMQFAMEGKYTPMASSFHLYAIHTILMGSPPNSFNEWEKMCFEMDTSNQIFGRGYNGKEFKLDCNIVTLSEMKCFEPKHEENATTLYLTWAAPNHKYIMLASCFPGNHKAWCLLSAEKVVDEETRKQVLDHVKELGFDPNKAVALNYKGCP